MSIVASLYCSVVNFDARSVTFVRLYSMTLQIYWASNYPQFQMTLNRRSRTHNFSKWSRIAARETIFRLISSMRNIVKQSLKKFSTIATGSGERGVSQPVSHHARRLTAIVLRRVLDTSSLVPESVPLPVHLPHSSPSDSSSAPPLTSSRSLTDNLPRDSGETYMLYVNFDARRRMGASGATRVRTLV